LASGGIAYIQDKKKGTLDRSRVAGVTTFDVLLAFMVTEGSVIIFQTLISLFLLIVCFGLVVQGSTTLFMLICLLTGIAGLSLGNFFTCKIDNKEMKQR
jgi:ABC-type multidrug transport system permease subunit